MTIRDSADARTFNSVTSNYWVTSCLNFCNNKLVRSISLKVFYSFTNITASFSFTDSLVSHFLYKSKRCVYSYELHQQVDAIQMVMHNRCPFKEVDKKYSGCNLKTMELLDYALIGVCAIIRLNTVCCGTHNICFCGEIRKIITWYPLLSGAMYDIWEKHSSR